MILTIYIAATLLQLLYWAVVFRRLARHPLRESSPAGEGAPGVSVIICVRNEAENLRRHLPRFLNQTYPCFEIVVVDDGSEDGSAEIVLDYQKSFSKLRLVRLKQPSRPGKKEALEEGVRAASFENLLFSDADCRPVSPSWIQYMAEPFESGRDMALGYSPYAFRPGWLNRFQRFETVYTAIQYFSFAICGMPYMGVGRNLAYRRTLFERQNGMQAHRHLISGDDDLFVNQASRSASIAVVLHPYAYTLSKPATSWKGYYNQKFRHNTAGSHYRTTHQLMLGGLSLSHVLHYVAGFALALQGGGWLIITGIFYLVRIVVVVWVCKGVLRRLGDRDLFPWIPVLDLLFLIYYFVFAPALITGRSLEQWK